MYKLVEVTPEEYVALGEAGVWVWACDDYKDAQYQSSLPWSRGDGHSVHKLRGYTQQYPNGSYYFKHYFSRVEQE